MERNKVAKRSTARGKSSAVYVQNLFFSEGKPSIALLLTNTYLPQAWKASSLKRPSALKS